MESMWTVPYHSMDSIVIVLILVILVKFEN